MEKSWDISEKTVLITGSTDGIGKQTAFEIAKKQAKIIIHGKNTGKLKNTVDEIMNKTGNKNIDYIKGDLSSLREIENMGNLIKEKYDKIDVLINNAGIFSHKKIITEDGFELTFQVNYLSHFYLTYLLFDLLKKDNLSRIINVSSMAHSSNLDFDNIQGELNYNGYTAYSYSKLLNILFTFELSDRIKDTAITVNCLHPGVINTKLLRDGWGFGGNSVKEGAKTSVYLASSEDVSDITGEYFVNKKIVRPASIALNKEIRKRIWKLSEKLLKIKFDI